MTSSSTAPSESATSYPKFLCAVVLVLVFVLGIGLRIFDITDEPISSYPLRQLQGAVIARGIYYELLTDVDEGIRKKAMAMERSMVEHEPRIQQSMVAYTYLLAGKEIPWVAGLYNTVFWMIGGVALFALAKRMVYDSWGANPPQAGTIAFLSALLALLYYLFLPFSVITSRSFQPDPGMVLWIILATYSIYRFSETTSWKWSLLSGLFSGIAILVKVMAFGPILGAAAAMLIYLYAPRDLRSVPSSLKQIFLQPKLWLMGVLMVSPAIIFYFGRQDRVSDYTTGWMVSLLNLLLTPGMYLSWAKLVIRLFHPLALLAALAGLWFARGRNRALLVGLWMGYFIYGLVFPYQIGTHDYYHLMLVPIVAWSMVPAFRIIISRLVSAPKIWQIGFAVAIVLVVGYYSARTIQFYAREDYRALPATWAEIAAQIPSDGKVIAVTEDFGMRLLYYGWRNVDIWPNLNQIEVRELRGKSKAFNELFDRQTKDKKYFLVTDFEEFDQQAELKDLLNENYTILNQGETWIIYDLSQPK